MISVKAHREGIAETKEKASKPARSLLKTLGCTAAAAVLGYAESTGKLPTGIFKNAKGQPMVPTKVAIATALHAVAYFSKGKLHATTHALGDTASIAYGYAAGKTHALVAGQ